MNESGKHTPGPWEWSGTVLVGDGGKVTLLRSVNVWNAKEADKALIAAAPDMLAALLRIVTEERAPGLFAASMPHDMREMARSALTKAGSTT